MLTNPCGGVSLSSWSTREAHKLEAVMRRVTRLIKSVIMMMGAGALVHSCGVVVLLIHRAKSAWVC